MADREQSEAQGGIARITTDATAPLRERAAFWVDMVCRHLVEVECQPGPASAGFHGLIAQRQVGQVDVSQVASCAQQVARTAALLAQATDEYFLLNIQREGNGVVRQDGREAFLAAGDMALYSSARRYALDFHAEFRQTVLVLPAAALRTLNPAIDRQTAVTLAHGQPLAALLAAMADNHFQTGFEQLPGQVAALAGDALIQTVAACTMAISGGIEQERPKLALFHLQRIRRYALAHLADSELCVAQVAAALAMSPAHIHRLFADETQTFSAWLWEGRLQGCLAGLRHTAQAHLSISQIAYRHGFANAAHFSRSFRERFGMSPREWRAQGLSLPGGNGNGPRSRRGIS